MARTLLTLVILGSLAAGCAGRIPFTQNLQERYSLKPEEVKDLQFFISHMVMLERRITAEQKVVSQNHKLVVRGGQKVEQIAILAGTPGVVEETGDGTINVSFEEGNALRFRANPAQGGRYVIECNNGSVELHTSEGQIPFKALGDSCMAFLQIDKSRMDTYEHRISIQKGRTLE